MIDIDKIQIVSMVKLESSAALHPNKQPYKGILCSVGSASIKAPCGSNGKKVVLSAEGSLNAVDTLKGMPLNVKDDFSGHDQSTVIGIIANAWLEDNNVWVEGYLFPQNYPKICASIKEDKEDLGFSYELLASSHETKDNTMFINEFTFIGACICFKDSAAYGADTQLIAAQINKEKEVDNMTIEEMQGIITVMFAGVDSRIADIKASVDAKVADIEAKVEASVCVVQAETDKTNKQVEDLAVALAQAKDEIKASTEALITASTEKIVIPQMTVLATGQTVVANGDFAGAAKDKKTKIAEVHTSALSMQEKMKKIVQINAGIEA